MNRCRARGWRAWAVDPAPERCAPGPAPGAAADPAATAAACERVDAVVHPGGVAPGAVGRRS
nr:hypothetical protein OH826_13010 [Streptomyces sp. NBC_00899]